MLVLLGSNKEIEAHFKDKRFLAYKIRDLQKIGEFDA